MEWALQKNPSWPAPFDSVYKNPETDITTPSAELSRREKEEQEASPLPNMVKGRQGERVRFAI